MGLLIPFRLRDKKDDDLIEYFSNLDNSIDRSSLIREALRFYVFKPSISNHTFETQNTMKIKLGRVEKSEEQLIDDLDNLLSSF